MADVTRRVKVEILGDAKGLKGATGEAEGALSKLGGGMSKLGGMATIAGAGLGALAVAGFGAAKAAAEDEKAAAALAKTMQNVAGATSEQIAATEDWISAQGRALGVTDDQLRPALDTLMRGTKDVGEAQKLAALAMDISAGTGKDLTAVSEALSKAYNGQLGPLKKLDPALASLVKSGASADEVFAALGQTFEGQAAAAANTTAGKMQRLQLSMSEAYEEVGARLLPVMAGLADFAVGTLLPALDKIVGGLERFGGWVGDNWQVIAAALTGLGVGVGVVLVPAFIAWATAAGAAALATLAAAAPVIAVGLAVAALGAGLMLAWQHSETFRTIVLEVWDKVRAAVEVAVGLVKIQIDIWVGAFDLAWQVVQGMWDIVGPLFDKVWTAVSNMVGLVKNIFSGDWAAAYESLKSTAKAGIDLVVDWFIGMPARIVTALVNLGGDLMGVASDALGMGTGFLGGLIAKVGDLMGWFKELPSKIVGWIGDLGSLLLNAGKQIIQGLIDGIQSMVGKLGDILGGITDLIPDLKGPMPVDLKLLYPSGKAIMQGLMSGIEAEVPTLRYQLGGITSSLGATPLSGGGRLGGATVVNNINVTVDRTMDPVEVGRVLMDYLDAAGRAGVRSQTLAAVG